MRKIEIYPTSEETIHRTAERFIDAGISAIQQRGVYSVALSGGSTPQPLYDYLAQDRSADRLNWNAVHFFWGDERAVPPNHPDSNYRHAFQALLGPRQIPVENIHRIQGELAPEVAAREYQREILSWLETIPPRFDLILLGLGADGHTASLFPGTGAVTDLEEDQWVLPNYVPQLTAWRITFTPQLINSAKEVIFLVTGSSKADAVVNVLEGSDQLEQLPAQSIQPEEGSLIWMLDADAGRCLSSAKS